MMSLMIFCLYMMMMMINVLHSWCSDVSLIDDDIVARLRF